MASVAAFSVTTGEVLYMHNYLLGSSVFNFGFCLLIFVMYVWWRDVVREATLEEQHNFAVQIGLRFGMILSGIPLEISRGNCDNCGVFFSENLQDAFEEINVRDENLIADGETRQEVRRLRFKREWAERREQERLQILRGIREYLANEDVRGNDETLVNENDVTSVPSTVELTASTISNLDSATKSFNIPETIDLPADVSVSSAEAEGFSCGDSNQSIDVVIRNNGVDSESLLTFEEEESLGENPYPSLRAYLAFEREENSMVENNPVNEEEIVNNIPSSSADKTSQEEVDVSSASSLAVQFNTVFLF